MFQYIPQGAARVTAEKTKKLSTFQYVISDITSLLKDVSNICVTADFVRLANYYIIIIIIIIIAQHTVR